MSDNLQTTTLAGGCFWCIEAIFVRLKGIISVMPCYAGGNTENPSYKEVCTGTTGYAEAVQIKFDEKQIHFDKLLEIFWYLHDPTTLNQQGADTVTQYRSAIFYNSEKQKEIEENVKKKIEKEEIYSSPIVTEITAFTNFYPAENYHKNYYDKNKNQPYCSIVISPKVLKLIKQFSGDLKEDYSK